MINLFSKIFQKKKKVYKLQNKKKQKLLVILRVRNEELIISDTLDHLANFCDGIICYDDASTDKTFDILRKHSKVYAIIRNHEWLPSPDARIYRETQDRAELLELATEYQPEWIFCADADERYLGDIRHFIDSNESKYIDAVRIQLFDAYITLKDREPFTQGEKLLNFRKYFGIERRDILMLWKNSPDVVFQGLDCREPTVHGYKNTIVKFYCQHYGKSLSVEHWEDTCNYYINHFPFDSYGKKWLERKGKAIHILSDFDTELQMWGEELFNRAKVIHPL